MFESIIECAEYRTKKHQFYVPNELREKFASTEDEAERIKLAHVVIERSTGTVVKNRHGMRDGGRI